jgi:hypothetical protein
MMLLLLLLLLLQMSCVYTITNKYGGKSTASATVLFQADDASCPPKAGAGCRGELVTLLYTG